MISVHEKVEEKTLVEVFQQIVQTPECALDNAAQCHFIMPTVAVRLQRNGINVIGNEAAMGPCSESKALLDHSPQNSVQPVLIIVGVVFNALDSGMDAHLASSNVYHGVD